MPTSVHYVRVSLALADSEHFRATGRANSLSRRFAVLHGYGLGILHLSLGTALHTIRFHDFLLCDSCIEANLFKSRMSII